MDEFLSEISGLIREVTGQEQSLNKELETLSQEVGAEIAQIENLKKEIESFGQEADNRVDKLRGEWEVILKRRTTFESDNLQVDLGMVAMYVEQSICAYVLPDVFLHDNGASLHELMNFLNSEDRPLPLDPSEYPCEEILGEARERWEIVCQNFNFPNEWKTQTGEWEVFNCTVPSDIRAIEVLKKSGVGINFPTPIHLKYAEENVKHMKDKMPPWQFKLVAAFIGSLGTKMTKIGLHHDYLILD